MYWECLCLGSREHTKKVFFQRLSFVNGGDGGILFL